MLLFSSDAIAAELGLLSMLVYATEHVPTYTPRNKAACATSDLLNRNSYLCRLTRKGGSGTCVQNAVEEKHLFSALSSLHLRLGLGKLPHSLRISGYRIAWPKLCGPAVRFLFFVGSKSGPWHKRDLGPGHWPTAVVLRQPFRSITGLTVHQLDWETGRYPTPSSRGKLRADPKR
jgi:hypothetical protein